jgi:CelD/BcsL family acetyltransferase involved in cellulose biosynthesis
MERPMERLMKQALEMLTADVVPARDLAASDMAAWRAMIAANPALDNPFFAPDFTVAVSQAREDVYVAAIRDRGLPLAYLPFQFAGPWQRRAGAAERVGGHLSDFCGVISGPDLRLTPAELLHLAQINAFTFSHLCAEQADMLGGEKPVDGLRANLGSGWNDYWTARRAAEKAFTADTDRSRRKIAETLGELRFTFNESDPGALEHLIAIKRAQYAKTGVADALAAPWTRTLLGALSRSRAIHCTGVVSTLYAGDTWVASHFGISSPRTLHYWFPVYNPELSRFSPGRLLLRAILEAAAGRRIATVDFGAGDAAYKRKLATATYQVFRGDWYRPGLTAFGYRVAQSLSWRLKAAAQTKTIQDLA